MVNVKNLLGPISSPIEVFIKTQPVVFSLIILYQGIFSGNGVKIPIRLKKLFEMAWFRALSIMLIALTATQDIEYAIVSTMIFLGALYTLKTPEERRRDGFI